MASTMLSLLFALSAIRSVASARMQDVPLGLCGECEVNCFEDCALKYDREIIQPENLIQTGKVQKHDSPKTTTPSIQQLAKKSLDVEMGRLKKHKTAKCSKKQGCALAQTCAKNVKAELSSFQAAKQDAASDFERINEEELDKAKELGRKGKDWTQASGMEATIADMPTFHAPSPAQLRMATSLVSQNSSKSALRGNLAPAPGGPNDPNDPLTYYPAHPVKINIFAKGLINLDQCLNFCLSTTCGCEGVPGMEDAKKMDKFADAGAKLGTHVVTPPVWKYRKAKKEECGNGLGDNKVIQDLYVDFSPGVDGWIEICTKKFFDITYGAAAMLGMTDATKDMEKCDCGVNRLDCHEPKYGCSWNNIKNRCEYKAMYNTVCYARYTFDRGL